MVVVMVHGVPMMVVGCPMGAYPTIWVTRMSIGVTRNWGSYHGATWRADGGPATLYVRRLGLLQNIIISDFLITIIGMSGRGGGVMGSTPGRGTAHSHAPNGLLLLLLIMHIVSIAG